jgi:hypothetical protein
MIDLLIGADQGVLISVRGYKDEVHNHTFMA